GAALLDAPVVAASENAPLMHQHRADRNAAFLKAEAGFVDGCLHEFVHGVVSLPIVGCLANMVVEFGATTNNAPTWGALYRSLRKQRVRPRRADDPQSGCQRHPPTASGGSRTRSRQTDRPGLRP